jgi:hypothetical protein
VRETHGLRTVRETEAHVIETPLARDAYLRVYDALNLGRRTAPARQSSAGLELCVSVDGRPRPFWPTRMPRARVLLQKFNTSSGDRRVTLVEAICGSLLGNGPRAVAPQMLGFISMPSPAFGLQKIRHDQRLARVLLQKLERFKLKWIPPIAIGIEICRLTFKSFNTGVAA